MRTASRHGWNVRISIDFSLRHSLAHEKNKKQQTRRRRRNTKYERVNRIVIDKMSNNSVIHVNQHIT